MQSETGFFRLWVLFQICVVLAACQASISIDQVEAPPTFEGLSPTISAPATLSPTPTVTIATSTIEAVQGGCQSDLDCTLVINLDTCCPCPLVMSLAEMAESENVIQFEPGENFGRLLPATCGDGDCPLCSLPPIAVCGPTGLCQAAETPELILQQCPNCYPQAAMAAAALGDPEAALTYCGQAENPTACLSSLFEDRFIAEDLSAAITVCTHGSFPDPAGCLTALAPEIAATDLEQAVTFCSQVSVQDARFAVCMFGVAQQIAPNDLESAREVCMLLAEELATECVSTISQ